MHNFTQNLQEIFNETYGYHWLGRSGPIGWPCRPLDFTCLEIFFICHLIELGYATPGTSVDDFVAQITVQAKITK